MRAVGAEEHPADALFAYGVGLDPVGPVGAQVAFALLEGAVLGDQRPFLVDRGMRRIG